MGRILLSARVTGSALIALMAFVFTRPVLPMKSHRTGKVVFEASEPINVDARIDSAALREGRETWVWRKTNLRAGEGITVKVCHGF